MPIVAVPLPVDGCNCQNPDAFHPAGDEAFCTRYRLVLVLADEAGLARTLRG